MQSIIDHDCTKMSIETAMKELERLTGEEQNLANAIQCYTGLRNGALQKYTQVWKHLSEMDKRLTQREANINTEASALIMKRTVHDDALRKQQHELETLEQGLQDAKAALEQKVRDYDKKLSILASAPEKIQALCHTPTISFNVLGQCFEIPTEVIDRADMLRVMVSGRYPSVKDSEGRLKLTYSPRKFGMLVEYLLDPVYNRLAPEIADYFGVDIGHEMRERDHTGFRVTPHQFTTPIGLCGYCCSKDFELFACSICHLCTKCDIENCVCFKNKMTAHIKSG